MWRSSLLLLLSLTIAVPAAAQGSSKGELDAARALANTGFDLYEAGRWAESLQRFEAAERIFHAPSHLLFIGRNRAKLGKLVAAREAYRKLVAETLAPDAPELFRKDQAAAKKELPALEERIAHLEVVVSSAPDGVKLTIDGTEASIGSSVDLDPGEHTIVVRAPGHETSERSIELAEGAKENIELTLTATPQAPEEPPEQEEDDSLSYWLPAGLMLGVGVVGLGLGGVTGAMALGKNADLEEACPNRAACPREHQALEDDGRTLGTVSTVGFIVGGAGVAAGLAWLLFWPTEPDEEVVARPFFRGQQIGVTVDF